MAKNISKVYLLNVPLEDDMRNTLYFANASAQQSYFQANIAKTYNNVSYQSDTRTFRCPDQLDTVRQYNYIMWQNTAYSNKWFYAFIKKMTYVSDGYTDVVFEVDPLQTFMFDIEVRPSFIEREHTNNDTPGNNTIPEDLELGEYVVNGSIVNTDYDPSSSENNLTWICFQVSDYPDGNGTLNPGFGDDVKGNLNGGVYTGLTYLMVLTPTMANRLIRCYDLANKSNAIVAIFQVPFNAINSNNIAITNQNNSRVGTITIAEFTGNSSTPTVLDSMSIAKPSSINSYVPRNKKLLTYPFTYFYVSNNAGTSVDFHWEDFNGNPNFTVDGVVCQGMSIKAYPTNYKNTSGIGGYDYGISGGKFPMCAWNSDYYTNWVTQNAVNMPLSVTSSVVNGTLGLIGSVATGNPLGAISGVANMMESIGSAVAKNYEASITPDQAKGCVNCGDLNVAEKRFGYTIYPMSIKAQFARVCDDWFDMFGYKVNRVKTPYVAHRQNWWYIKTIGANIVGNVPNEEMNKIKEAYNNGLTYWRNPSNFLNYSVSNGIV